MCEAGDERYMVLDVQTGPVPDMVAERLEDQRAQAEFAAHVAGKRLPGAPKAAQFIIANAVEGVEHGTFNN